MNSLSRSAVIATVLLAAGTMLHADPTLDKLIADSKFKEAIDYADDKLPTSQRDAAVWVQVGVANEGLDMPEKALACYLVGWRMSPDNYAALLGAAKIYNKLGQPDNAINMAKKALDKSFTAEASWEYARACIALNRTVEAKAALEKVIESDPANAIANNELGNIYFNESAWAKALPLLKKTYATKPEGGLAYRIGKAYGATAMPDSAIVYLKEAITRGGAPAIAALELARAYYGQNNFSAASAQYLKIPAENMTAMDFYQAAIACEKSSNQQSAQIAYEKAASLFGADKGKEALLSREKVARAYLEKKTYNMALGNLEFIADADPKAAVVPEVYFMLADCYQGISSGPKAIAALEKALALNNKNVEAYARLADLYQKNGMPDKAKQTLETMMALSPNDPNIYLSLGQYNLKAKKYEEALAQFGKANALAKSGSAAQGMAIAAFNLNKLDVAADAAESAVSLDSNAWDARVVLATVQMQGKNYKEAMGNLAFMVKKEPANLSYKTQLATCYEQNGEKAKLLDLDKQIIVQSPTNVESRFRLAQDADARNDMDAALILYRELSVLQPKNADVFYRLYEILRKKNSLNDAALNMGRYIELKPGAEAQRDYGDVLYQLKDFDRALTAYRAALKLNPSIKGFHKRYAEIVIAKGQQDEVITALSGVVQSGEADVGTYQTLGMIYQKKSDYKKAIEMYQKALQLDAQNNESLAALAACQAASGALNDAVISYEQVVMMDTNAFDAYHELGDIYHKQGNSAAAAKNYKRYFVKNPADQVVAKRLGKFAFDNQAYPDVIKYLAMLQFKTDEDMECGMMYASAAIAVKQYKDAIRVLEQIRAAKPKPALYRPLLKTLAEAYEKDGQDANAAECYGLYSGLQGVNDPDAAYKHALLLEKSNPPAAQKAYENNTRQFAGDYRNYLRLGLLLSANKETFAKAAQFLKKTTALADTISSVWLELGRVYGKMGSEQDELETYRHYLQIDPQNAEANKRAGVILAKKGQMSDALIYLEVANTLTPNDPEVMFSLAKGYAATNRAKEAVELLKKAKAAKKDDPDIRSLLFEMYMKTGQKEMARDEIKELVAMKRDNAYLLQYANASIATGDLKTAEGTIEDILATEADNIDVLMLKAKVKVLNKKYEEAVETYKEISYIDPNHAPSMTERANIYLLQSKPQWAETFFQRALKANPKYARAELGLALVAKMRKDTVNYQSHLDKARLLDPFDEDIQEEAKKAGK